MNNNRTVAVVKWGDHDALARAFANELQHAGYEPLFFRFDQPVPLDAFAVFSFAPYGRWAQIPLALSARPPEERPRLLHWNTENPPDLNLPWALVSTAAALRARIDRLHDDARQARWVKRPPFHWVDQRFKKFRYVGETHAAAQRGLLDLYFESSEIYAALHSKHGLYAEVVPWGTVPEWCAGLKLERDIDVVWFGQRRTRRRSQMLDRVRDDLKARGIKIYMADGIEQPFVHGSDRTELLNRAKISLNLLPTWYDHAFPYRFHVAAGNRSLVVTEPTLQHSSWYREGEHYVSAPPEKLAETIAYYVQHPTEWRALTENAYELVTTQMTMGHSVRAIMAKAERLRGEELTLPAALEPVPASA